MKTKIVVLIGLALCTILLIFPALASDTDTLDIYGNANEDDTIDMRDLTYVKLIVFGERPETELADAKYDGEINPLDFVQIKLIIVGKQKELTIVDSTNKVKTFNLPITRIIAIDDRQGESLRVLEAEDLVVGVGFGLAGMGHETILPKMSKLPMVGGRQAMAMDIDYEKVLSLKHDLFFCMPGGVEEGLEGKLEPYGVQVLYLYYTRDSLCKLDDIIKLGYLLGKVNKAEEVVDFCEEYIEDKIKTRTDGLSEDKKPKVFLELGYQEWVGMTCSKGTPPDEICNIAGGINIAHDITGSGTWPTYPSVDPEWILDQNPEIVLRLSGGGRWGYTEDVIQKQEWEMEMEAVREETMKRPGWDGITAVKNGDVYIVSGDLHNSALQGVVFTAYCAKWFHPDLFEDLDPEAIHQEYIDEFLRIDYDLDEGGIFVYPEPS